MILHNKSFLVICLLVVLCQSWEYSGKFNKGSPLDEQKQYWFSQILDHYDYVTTTKWSQRYYAIQDSFDPKTGPVILYICGEGICNGIRDNRNWPSIIANQTKGLILSLEHRYYGQSLPFGNSSLTFQNLKYLNSEQAMKDLAYFIQTMVAENKFGITAKTPWITVGGSYPGALSAWFRAKYPHLTIGALASSAVVLAVEDFDMFDEQIYLSSKKSGDFCVAGIQAVTAYVEQQVISDNWQNFQKQFNAQKLTSRQFLFYWADVIVFQVQYGRRVTFCNNLFQKSLPQQFNYIKSLALQVDPKDYSAYYLKNDTYAIIDGRGARSWIYQSCTEFSYFQTPSYTHPMRSKLLTLDFYRAWCENIFGIGVWPYVKRVNTQFGGVKTVATNLFMSNGDEDPWKWASILSSKGPIISKVADCDDCAHCQDFHNPSTSDAKSLTQLRTAEMSQIKKWISNHFKQFEKEL